MQTVSIISAFVFVVQNETEWLSFLRQCLEFVGKVSELFPVEVFQMVLPLLESYSQIYLSLGDIVTVHNGGECMLSVQIVPSMEML